MASPQAKQSRRAGICLAVGMIGLTLMVFGAGIWFLSHQLRDSLRGAIVRQDGEVLHAATLAGGTVFVDPEAPGETVALLVEASNFRADVFAIRLYDTNGVCLARFPTNLAAHPMAPENLRVLKSGEVLNRFHGSMDLSQQFSSRWIGRLVAPVVQAVVPLGGGETAPLGYAEFLLDGEKVAAGLEEVDGDVRRYALLFGVVGGAVIAVALGWAFFHLNKANRLLAQRTANLLKANHELALAAKTSAVGAVAAHLIHALKNPLFGIQMFVSCAQSEKIKPNETHWQAAANSAERMQKMIAEVVRILREDAGTTAYEVTIEELVQILRNKVAAATGDSGVELRSLVNAEGILPNREANLIVLALTNLIQNGMQASPAGSVVELRVFETDSWTCFDVSDHGPGLPEHVQKTLFSPTQSGKTGGTGIGLAITKQLVNHMGGRVELVETSARGTTFRLSLPGRAFTGREEGEQVAAGVDA